MRSVLALGVVAVVTASCGTLTGVSANLCPCAFVAFVAINGNPPWARLTDGAWSPPDGTPIFPNLAAITNGVAPTSAIDELATGTKVAADVLDPGTWIDFEQSKCARPYPCCASKSDQCRGSIFLQPLSDTSGFRLND